VAAFTTFSSEALERYLVMFGRGRLKDFKPTPGGIENSNYFVDLDNGGSISSFVLTIMESHGFDEMPFFNKVMTQLKHYGLPVAAPVMTLDGMTSTIFCGKPAFLIERLPGEHLETIDAAHCEVMGRFIASSHRALGELSLERENPYDLNWMQDRIRQLPDSVSLVDRALLTELAARYEELLQQDLHRGLIHGDLFQDNALFAGGELTGVIDFYHACTDLLIQDLAIAINDWCLDDNRRLDTAKRDAMMRGYEGVRALSEEESASLLSLQQVSAARFALTRIDSGDPPLKNPREMLDLAVHLMP